MPAMRAREGEEMKKITVEQVAEALTSQDGDYDDGLEVYWSASAKGNVVNIKVTDDDDNVYRFRATVEAVDD